MCKISADICFERQAKIIENILQKTIKWLIDNNADIWKTGAKYNSLEYVSNNDCSTEMENQLLDQKGNVAFQHLKNGRAAYARTSQKK